MVSSISEKTRNSRSSDGKVVEKASFIRRCKFSQRQFDNKSCRRTTFRDRDLSDEGDERSFLEISPNASLTGPRGKIQNRTNTD